MNSGLEKFRELLLTDEEFQNKLKAAAQAYKGEQTEKAVFDNVLVPVAGEYGITASFDELMAYIEKMNDQELNTDEISQVAGGGPKGFGYEACYYIGTGIGGTSSGGCALIGGTDGGALDFCAVKGTDIVMDVILGDEQE